LDKIHTSKTSITHIQSNLSSTARYGELQKWPLLAGGLWNYLYDFHETN